MRTTTSLSSTALEVDLRRLAGGHVDQDLEQPLNVGHADPGTQPGSEIDLRRLAEGLNGRPERGRVGQEDRVRALAQGHVHQSQRLDCALGGSGDVSALKAHPLADPEGPCAQEHHAGEDVGQCLLRREAENHCCERAAHREVTLIDAGDAQCGRHRHEYPEEPDEKSHRSRGGRVQPAQELGTERAARSRARIQPRISKAIAAP
jgi:hypothetical protein